MDGPVAGAYPLIMDARLTCIRALHTAVWVFFNAVMAMQH